MATESNHEQTALQRRTFAPDEWPSKKTVDVGRNGVTVSADPFGGIYQVSSKIPNDKYAMMIAAPWRQFDQKDRQKPEVVREYRKHMERRLQARQPGLGLRLDMAKGQTIIRPVSDSLGSSVQIDFLGRQDKQLFVQTVLKVRQDGTIVQTIQVTNTGPKKLSVPVSLDLAFAVSRASYGQLTDQGEVPMPDPSNTVHVWGRSPSSAGEKNKTQAGPWSDTICFDNESMGSRLSAKVAFYNVTTKAYVQVDEAILPSAGQDPDPPSLLHEDNARRPRSQTLRVGPLETLRLGCVLRPDAIVFPDAGPCWGPDGHEDPAKLLDPNLFAHDDGVHEPLEVMKRYLKALAGAADSPCELPDTIEQTIFWANVNYIIGCCSAPVGNFDCWAVIPDHIALPLGWPRDNYWQLRLLSKLLTSSGYSDLFPGKPNKAVEYSKEIQLITRGHLDWLFNLATTEVQIGDETRHFWRRSYLINGQPKDGIVYQLDTQLYPFLQLCEYYDDLAKLGMLDEKHVKFVEDIVHSETFGSVLADVLRNQDPELRLFRTDETPADDDTKDFPFLVSSNILVWHAMVKLSGFFRDSGLPPPPGIDPCHLRSVADEVFEGIRTLLVCECLDGSGQSMLAYALDPSKPAGHPARHRRYHDGNDMPTVMAQEWGFLSRHATSTTSTSGVVVGGRSSGAVKSSNSSSSSSSSSKPETLRAIWEKTMEWALTPDPEWTSADHHHHPHHPASYNSGYAGRGTERFHGLGSDHSGGAWVLGFFQEWKHARAVRDAGREARAWAKIAGSMQWDGTFSEAVDVRTGACTSKTWFSWPGAMVAAELVETVVAQARAR